MGERTVYTYLSHSEFPEWQPHPDRARSKVSQLDAYKPYVLEQWNQGRQDAKPLFEEIQHKGSGQLHDPDALHASLRADS